uniref:glutathione peroxidase n=1 Tax=Hucho hucho TaxID=62062 RepID=A0A4W5N9B4_9TELE
IMTLIAKTYDLKSTMLERDSVDFNVFRRGQPHRPIQLNLLQSKYLHRLVVLGFPCNWFGYQFINVNFQLQLYVRPGDGYQPGFTVFEKCDVNGTNIHPGFDPKFLTWSTVSRTDISWIFEKFLVGPEGEPFKRYSKKCETINMEPEIQTVESNQDLKITLKCFSCALLFLLHK